MVKMQSWFIFQMGVNSYSTDLRSWEKVHKKYNIIITSAIVYYNDFTFMNATLEKKFSKKKY